MKIAFFGGEPLSIPVLEELKNAGIIPDLVVCNPDRSSGRKMVLTPPPIKVWSKENNIEVFQPETYKDEVVKQKLIDDKFDLFIVVAYGKILPKWLVNLPRLKTINVHPSLLPQLRGPSPIRSAILNDMRETGVTIMQMDDEMDHGPIITQKIMDISPENWPIDGAELDLAMAHLGGALLASIIPDWIDGKITPTPQDHDKATYCTKITKDMAELKIDPHNLPSGSEAYQTLLKIRAFAGWPETFFIHDGKRYKIKQAEITKDGKLNITRIIPEGKKETDFATYFHTN
jgi:methionyl-tRNA formyltransferase